MKKLKKIVTVVLALSMLMSLMSVTAFAAEPGTQTDEDGNVTVVVQIEENATTEYEYAVSETEDRKVTVEAGEITTEEGSGHGDLVSTDPTVSFEEYEGKQEVHDEVYPGSDDRDKDLFQGGGYYDNSWSMALRMGYIKEETDADGNSKYVLNTEMLKDESPYGSSYIEGMDPEYLLIASAEGVFSDIVFKEVEYELDENGNVKLDENGEPVYQLVKMKDQPYVAPMVLWGNDGKAYYAYSLASENEAWVYSLVTAYEAKDLTEVERFKNNEDAQEHVRGIALHGYWGADNTADENGSYKVGSLNKLKEEMLAAVEKGKVSLELNGSTDVEAIKGAIAGLTEGDALTATQAAFWAFSNGTEADVENGDLLNRVITGEFTGDSNGYIGLVYQYLLTVTEKEQELIGIDKDSMNLIVGEKLGETTVVEGDASITCGNYDVSLNFNLTIVPGEKDELSVVLQYIDADGTLQTVTKALGTENNEYTIAPDPKDGSYTLTGLKLSEDQDITFDLRLEGTQYLENGVYVYAATHTNDGDLAEMFGPEGAHSTLIGVGETGRNVNSSASVTVKFHVEDTQHESGNGEGTGNPTVQTTTTITDADVPLESDPEETVVEILPEDVPLTELPDDEVPLASVPMTGDASALWMLMSVLSGASLAGVTVLGRKKIEEN